MATSLFGVGTPVSANVNGTLIPQTFTATAGQTVFNLSGWTYTPGTNSLLVWINGSKQILTRDFVESSAGNSFTLVEGALVGDLVEVIGFPEITLTAWTNIAAVTGNNTAANSGFWPDSTPSVKINRVTDRLFVYKGVESSGNFSGPQGGIASTSANGANWAPRDSVLFAASDRGLMAVTGFASNENMPAGAPTETIGASGFVIGKQAGKSVWGLYSDVQYEAGTSGWGVEFAVKNKSGVDLTATPYFFVSGACGIWLPAGGDSSYGGAPTNPNNFAIGVGANSSTWNKGLIFFATGLTRDGSGYATAIELAEKHRILWRTSGNNTGFDLRSEVTGASANVAQVVTDNTITYYGTGVAPMFAIAHNSSGINYLRINNASNTNLPSIVAAGGDTDIGIQIRTKGTQAIRFQSQNSGAADEFRVGGINSSPVNFLWAYGTNSGQQAAVLGVSGTDSNIDIVFTPKGTGTLKFGTWTSNADAPVNGYITIKDSAGNTRKLATIA